MSTGDSKLDRPIEFQRRESDHQNAAAVRRTQMDAHSADKNGLDFSRIPSPSTKSGIRPRRTFGKTSTLTGAFEAAAPQQETPEEPEADREHAAVGSPSPPARRVPKRNRPRSGISSPPDELIETYRQINDSDDLVNLVSQDEFDVPSDSAQVDRRRRVSPNTGVEREQQQDQQQEQYNERHNDVNSQSSGFSFLDDVTDDSFRNKMERHAIDEQRLRRVTTKDSPVFTKAKVGQKAARAAETLQRRSEEENNEEPLIEDRPGPSLNIPKSWGGRGQASKDRLSYVGRRNVNLPAENQYSQDPEPEPEPVQEWENDIDFTARDLQVSDSPPVQQQTSIPVRGEIDRFARKAATASRLEELRRRVPHEQIRPSIEEGDPIPNRKSVV